MSLTDSVPPAHRPYQLLLPVSPSDTSMNLNNQTYIHTSLVMLLLFMEYDNS